MEDGRIDNGTLKRWAEVLVGGASGTNTSSTYTVDLTQGNVFNLILNASCAFTFSNPTGSGAVCSFTMVLSQDGTGSRTATWPSAVVWQSGTAPTLSTAANAVDVLSFVTYDGGGTWFGFMAAKNMQALWVSAWIPYGYFGGGRLLSPSTLYTRVDRIDYSNDTATAVSKGPLTIARYRLAGTGNSSFGYFGGGYNNSPATVYSRVDRLDYSNDTATAVSKGPLSLARQMLAATGNSSFGYFGGGYNLPTTYSRVDRIDYSNDTPTAAVKGPVSTRFAMTGTGTSAYGYIGGSTTVSAIDRIDYSNDTATALVKAPLSTLRFQSAATGNQNFGYFGGGYKIPNTYSVVDRINYASDTSTAVVKGPLSISRANPAAAGNSSFGYFGGGTPASPATATYSTVDRIDYSNDTATAAVKGPLFTTRYTSGATNHAAM